jgi:predicted amidohydrolase YtcJ
MKLAPLTISKLETLLLSILLACNVSAQAQANECIGINDMVLTNGKIITVDENDSIADSIHIRNGKIISLNTGEDYFDGCGQSIDLKGHTVIPGLIDSHVHFLRAGTRPGHDLREIEFIYTIPELLNAIKERTKAVPEGEFITAFGGFYIPQFKENRLPNLKEIDSVAPRHGVLLRGGIREPAVTNSIGKALFESAGIEVGVDGSLKPGFAPDSPVNTSFALLNKNVSFNHKVEQTARVMRIANQMGLTTVLDAGGRPEIGAMWFDKMRSYDVALKLIEQGRSTIRMRAVMPNWNKEMENPGLRGRVDYNFMNFGNDWFRIVGFGEEVVGRGNKESEVTPANMEGALRIAAEHGWTLTQHSGTAQENEEQLSLMENVNKDFPVKDLRWTLAHVRVLSDESINRLEALGAGVTVQSGRYFDGSMKEGNGGPPYKRILDSGLPMGSGSDGTNVYPMNPWPGLYYITTGINIMGDPINKGQTLTRLQALRIYTIDSAYVSFDEDELGSLEVGKFGDLVVLDNDYLTTTDDNVKNMKALLTVVDGKIVYGSTEMLN